MEKEQLRGEVDHCRPRLLKYCQGQGLDLGCGFSKIKKNAIGIDIVSPMADMNTDARSLREFPDEHFDYIFSSHFLEEVQNIEATLKEWVRVIKKGGNIVLYQADREYYYPIGDPLCNKKHLNHFLWEDLWEIFKKIGGFELVHHDRFNPQDHNEWSFELVVKKSGSDIEKKEEPIDGISILIPTLNRPDNMETFSVSVNNTSSKPELIEIIFGIHSDDPQSIEKAKELDSRLKISIRYELIERYPDGKAHLSFLWNQIYEKACYPILGYFGDDVVFKTPGWDEEVRKELRADKAVMVSCNDVHIQRGRTATLFFTHRIVHEKVGFYLHPGFRRWFSDTFWDNVYRACGKMHYREDIITEHFHPDVFPDKLDEVYKKMDNFKNEDRQRWNSETTFLEIRKAAEILKSI